MAKTRVNQGSNGQYKVTTPKEVADAMRLDGKRLEWKMKPGITLEVTVSMSSAIGYTRLSRDSDTSIDRQKRHIREYADKNGLLLDHIYDDGERSSGFDESRQEYQ